MIMYFIRGMYKELNIIIILMMKEKEKLHQIIIYYVKIINSPKPKKSNQELVESSYVKILIINQSN